ncbi:unnamed protein product [Pseudo-nitzschia multistriata]|uniref:TPM domain-containing protein n=1 Tax=Pseudo-nitzschia multistriata TaxID=183589 RepID=A0A448ZQ85_9STRA|nr:unnamed protein product [Pseudo-nitzschia multistriata]
MWTLSLSLSTALLAATTASASDWVVPEDERQEAYGRSSPTSKKQVKLDPLQVCLYPTYLTLPEGVLRSDLRQTVGNLVSERLEKDLGDEFVYFALTADASIDWYSGEEGASCGSLGHRLPVARNGDGDGPGFRSLAAARTDSPCTCALYSGAVVLLEGKGASPESLEPGIASSLAKGLVGALRDGPQAQEQQRPFYTELKGALVSWSAAERKPGGKLYVAPTLDQDEAGQQQLAGEESSSDGKDPIIPVVLLDEGTNPEGTYIGVNALEEQQEGDRANAFETKRGKILAGVLGGLLLVALCAICVCLRRSRRGRDTTGPGGSGSTDPRSAKDAGTVVCDDDDEEEGFRRDGVDEEIANPLTVVRPRRVREGLPPPPAAEDSEDASATAQYAGRQHHGDSSSSHGASLLDCVSVGSEWTLTTNGVASALGRLSSGGRDRGAETVAARETFDRDRQITLQKDMLQSEWTAGLQASGHHPSAAGGSALPFQDATGQGEEIFLVEPARSRR